MQNRLGTFLDILNQKGVSRRDFLKFTSLMAGVLAMPKSISAEIAKALETKKRTPVIWLEMQDCAGCSEAFLRASRPTAAEIVLDVLSVDYHETIMAAAGKQAEEAKAKTMQEGGYLLVVEGSIPQKDDGIYCCIGGRSALDLLQEAAKNAAAVVAVGSCAAYGGLPKANPNPTGAVAVDEIVKDKPILNLPGCPYNVVNLTATVVHFLTFGELPAVDNLKRPLFAYGARIHDNCERRGHFDAGEFVRAWGDEGHRKGWCLYQMGCKGPATFANCPTVRFNEGTSWPVLAGHGCIGCTQPGFWEMEKYQTVAVAATTPGAFYPDVNSPQPPVSPVNAAVTGAVVGVMAGVAGTVAINQLGKAKKVEQPVEEQKKSGD
jgi:hydrogenase small subunit